MKLPEKFEFTCGGSISGQRYSATVADNACFVDWCDDAGATHHVEYSVATVEAQIMQGRWLILKTFAGPTPPVGDSLLAIVKQFTIDTGSSVFVCDGGYEVYYCGADNPAKAATDEKLVEVMKAVRVLAEAMLQDASLGIA